MQDEILTLPEVAQLLKVAEKTVYTMAQRERLPAFKVGGQWRFKRVDFDQWIEQQKAARHIGDSNAPTKYVDEIVRKRTSPAVKSALTSPLDAPAALGAAKKTRGGRRDA